MTSCNHRWTLHTYVATSQMKKVVYRCMTCEELKEQ